jgi:hypothetical protein
MAQGEGLIKGGGTITEGTRVRGNKVRKYQRRLDIRSAMRPYMESTSLVRSPEVCRKTAEALRRKLKTCPPYVGSAVLKHLSTVQSEDHLEHVLDEVWLLAEQRRVLLIA